MPGEFDSKVVVITGGSRGIGKAIGAAFAREGAQTVLAAGSQENLDKAADEIAKTRALKPMVYAVDLKTPEACERLHARVKERFGRCDVLVNNAGATRSGKFTELPDALWLDGFALKFFACVRLCRAFWPMLTERQGHVVNIIGGAARTPEPEFLIGGSVNSAMSNFTKGLSNLGKQDGVNVNAIHPGLTETDRVVDLFKQRAQAANRPVADLVDDAVKKTGIRRIGKPEDVAELALFLCSERARHIQGTAIAVDGGQTPGLY